MSPGGAASLSPDAPGVVLAVGHGTTPADADAETETDVSVVAPVVAGEVADERPPPGEHAARAKLASAAAVQRVSPMETTVPGAGLWGGSRVAKGSVWGA